MPTNKLGSGAFKDPNEKAMATNAERVIHQYQERNARQVQTINRLLACIRIGSYNVQGDARVQFVLPAGPEPDTQMTDWNLEMDPDVEPEIGHAQGLVPEDVTEVITITLRSVD